MVEVLVGVTLFALIAAMGLAMLDAVARVRAGTQGELDAIAALQRTEALLTDDLVAVRPSSLTFTEREISFERQDRQGRWVQVSYALSERTLSRRVGGTPQPLLATQSDWRWRAYERGSWTPVHALDHDARISAVEVTLLDPERGEVILRRVIRLPDGTTP